MIDRVKTGENILKLRKQKNLSVKELQKMIVIGMMYRKKYKKV